MKNIYLLFLLLVSVTAKADLLADCNTLSSEINGNTPKTIDKITILKNSTCFKDGKTTVLSYNYAINVPVGTASQTHIDGMKKGMLLSWCSNPDTRKIIDVVDIENQYSYKDGAYIGKMRMSKKQC